MNDIKMGKNIIDNLTTGMYADSKIIYREYIQNSTDAIDKANALKLYKEEEKPYIDIEIEPQKRLIRIKDNATGISKENIHNKLANIADSDKEKGIEKGFRGIGRLGGLAYCDELRFITSCKGEPVKTIMSWNSKECKRLVEDRSVNASAEEILKKIIKYEEEKCDVDEHFFIVELCNINNDNNDLLDEEKVKKYVQWNAPVPYNAKLIYRTKVMEYAEKIEAPICQYNIQVEGEDICKNYGTILYEKPTQSKQRNKYDQIYGVEFKEFKNHNGELIAWMWYGISAFNKQIPQINEMRGIRLRKENIQIGTPETLSHLFYEYRGNYYFIGEVHAIHKDLIPNARRDYFNENSARNEFEVELKYYFKDVLHRLYNEGNKAKVALKRKVNYKQKLVNYEELKKKGFINEQEKEKVEKDLEDSYNECKKFEKNLENIKENAKGNNALEKVISLIQDNYKQDIKRIEGKNEDENKRNNKIKDNNLKPPKREVKNVEKNEKKEPKISGEKKLISDGLNNMNRKQRLLVAQIYGIINNVLPQDLSRNLIEKIQEELNK